ncbi:MaoC family dehydratase [Candidatus Pacearchaeota archaeon]|nr:MaoC family dehydratase [Candidatus Pacearchaeota archaeon]
MTTFPLSGISNLAARLFRIAPREDENLEKQINETLAEERERIQPSSEDITSFGDMTEDHNPIHRDKSLALKKKLLDTPVMGAHTAIYGAQFVNGVTERMKKFWGTDIKMVSQESRFPAPIYPGDKIRWQIVDYKEVEGNQIELDITGYKIRDEEKKEAVKITSRLGDNYALPEIKGTPIYSQKYMMTEDLIRNLHQRTGGNPSDKPLHMFAVSFVPTTLTKLLLEKSNTLEGINGAMDYKFTGDIKPGELSVDVYRFKETRTRGGAFWYRLDAHCRQGKDSIAYGEMLCTANQLVDLPLSI